MITILPINKIFFLAFWLPELYFIKTKKVHTVENEFSTHTGEVVKE